MLHGKPHAMDTGDSCDEESMLLDMMLLLLQTTDLVTIHCYYEMRRTRAYTVENTVRNSVVNMLQYFLVGSCSFTGLDSHTTERLTPRVIMHDGFKITKDDIEDVLAGVDREESVLYGIHEFFS